ncbi:MAG: sulfotransferase [Magnetococcales bacterium]|nr:sulfotransferase [Magnetococcales bacterium]
MSDTKLKIIYVAGAGRSGTTIVDRVLGAINGVTSFNEVYRLWEEGFSSNNMCACGAHFRQCQFWNEVIKESFGTDIDSVDIEAITKLHHTFDHSRHVPKLLRGKMDAEDQAALMQYSERLKALYAAMIRHSGTEICVDSSKVPSRPLLLNNMEGVQVNVLHIIRDPRAVVYAWNKKKFNPATGEYLKKNETSGSISAWLARNILSKKIMKQIPGVTIRYEDFALQPRATIQRVIDELPLLNGLDNPFVTENSIDLPKLHSIGGNPHRFKSGMTDIRFDDEWKRKMPMLDRMGVSLVTLPWLIKYGYL